MDIQFKRILFKQISLLKQEIPKKQIYSHSEVADLLSEFQKKLEGSFVVISEANDQKLSESKNLLKKTNKAFNDFRITSDKRQLEVSMQNENLRKQVQRSKKKVHELLKISQKYQEGYSLKQEKITFERGTQCYMKDSEMQRMIEEGKKQNIQLKQRICELQNQVSDHKQDIEAANVLIKELVRQLETNMADRETWYGTGSSNASELDSLDRLEDSEGSFESENASENYQSEECPSEREQVISLVSACGHGEGGLNEDCSTIDGSNATNKDYALPEWLQFGQTPTTSINSTVQLEKSKEFDLEQIEEKMWPQLIWDRLKKLIFKA